MGFCALFKQKIKLSLILTLMMGLVGTFRMGGGGGQYRKFFFWPFGLHFGLKIKGEGGPGPPGPSPRSATFPKTGFDHNVYNPGLF